jgi:hypothetical protein
MDVILSHLGESDVKLTGGAPSAYNKTLEEGLIPLDMAHPAAQMIMSHIDPDIILIGDGISGPGNLK